MSVYSKLNEIKQIKADIKAAMIAKGVTFEDTDTFADYPSKIESMQTSSAEEKHNNISEFVSGNLDYFLVGFSDMDYSSNDESVKYSFLKEAAAKGDKFTTFKHMLQGTYFMFDTTELFEILSTIIQNSKDELGSNPFKGLLDGCNIYDSITLNMAGVKDIVEILKGNTSYTGTIDFVDTSSVTNWNDAFDSYAGKVKSLDFSSATHMLNTFNNAKNITTIDFSTTTDKLAYFRGVESSYVTAITNLNICGVNTETIDFSKCSNIASFTCQAGTITGTFKTLNLSNNNLAADAVTNLLNSLPTYAAASEADRKTIILTGNTGTTAVTDEVIANLATKGWNVTV